MLKSVLGECTTVAATVVLARLLTPAQFGHAAVALLFVLLAVILTFEGFSAALVQRPDVRVSHQQAAVLLNLIGGTVLAGIVLCSALFLWQHVFGSETANLIAITSPAFLLASVGAVSRANLWRRLAFDRMTQIDLAAGFLGSASSVTLAVLGFGASALVIGAVLGVGVGAVLQLLAAPEPLPRWHLREVREIARYGLPASLAGLVNQLFANIDYWIVAARLSAYQTGIYYRAFNVGVLYQSKISGIMMQLAFPVYSRIESRQEMRRLHERAARVHAVVIFPFLALLIALAPVAIPFVFGQAWRPAVGPAQILAVAGMAAAILTGYPQVMEAVGKPLPLLVFNIAALAIYGTAIALAATHGLVVVSVAATAVYVAILVGAYEFLLKPHLGLSLARLVPEMGPAVGGCLALLAVCEPLRMLLAPHLPAALTILVVASVGLVLYAATLRTLFRTTWRDLETLAYRTVPSLQRLRARDTPTASTATPG